MTNNNIKRIQIIKYCRHKIPLAKLPHFLLDCISTLHAQHYVWSNMQQCHSHETWKLHIIHEL